MGNELSAHCRPPGEELISLHEIEYVCPLCHCGLCTREGSLYCEECDRAFPLRRGIRDFATRTHYWNQVTAEQMESILEIAQDRGYRYAVERVLVPFTHPDMRAYVLGENRADFRAVVPITPTSRVLDLGGGWGPIPCALAPACESVTTVDTNPYTLRFIRLRAEQTGLTNLTPVRIDPLDDAHLPFPDGSFDVAVMNGVLEWVGEASSGVSPEEVQRRCLHEVRRVLAPDGKLYVGIENRFGYNYFLGHGDHGGVRFTSLMPRRLASIINRIRQHRPYRTYTYSYSGYRALLRSAGFEAPKVFLAIPSYRDPEFIVPANDDRAILYFVKQRAAYIVSRMRRSAVQSMFRCLPTSLSCGLVRRMVYSYVMVAGLKA